MWFNLLLVALGLFLYFLKRNYNYWKDRGVPGPSPVFIFGNFGQVFFGNKSINDIYSELYKKYNGLPFIGAYRMLQPILIVREPELIKNMVVKDFKHFPYNEMQVDKNVDRILGRHPFLLRGLEWKTKRAHLSSCFTSGKMKAMYPMIEEVGDRMVQYIEKNCTEGSVLMESKELCVRYTLETLAACAFGIEGNCFSEEYSVFRSLGAKFLSPGSLASIKSSLLFTLPPLGRLLKFQFVSTDVEDQMLSMVRNVIDERRKNNIVRNDFLESVLQFCKSSDLYNEEIDVIAQAATFFFDGYETSSWAMSSTLFMLAANPDCQKKLREEINSACAKSNQKLDYETIHGMPYLTACVNESMRLIPVFRHLFKVCNERYTYTCKDPEFENLTVTVEPGTTIVLPVEGLQRDEKYYKSPEKFMPERFLDKTEFNKFCFLPFGEGPRSCLGIRFAMTQIKLGVAQIIRSFELSVNNKTQLPLKMDKWYLMSSPIGGLWIDLKKI